MSLIFMVTFHLRLLDFGYFPERVVKDRICLRISTTGGLDIKKTPCPRLLYPSDMRLWCSDTRKQHW